MGYEISDPEYIILENIYDSGERKISLRQRDLAQIAGTSLGMTNAILRRLAHKGWINIKKLNRRNIQYAVTLEGINEITHRSYSYFKKTIQNVVYYKDALDGIIRRAAQKNIKAVLLVGVSDLDFIVEHICLRRDILFLRAPDQELAGETKSRPPWRARSPLAAIPGGAAGDTFIIYSETIGKSPKGRENSLYLSELVLRQACEKALAG